MVIIWIMIFVKIDSAETKHALSVRCHAKNRIIYTLVKILQFGEIVVSTLQPP